jgi:hypothetical protein
VRTGQFNDVSPVAMVAMAIDRVRGSEQGSAFFIARAACRGNPPLPQSWAPTARRRFYAIALAPRSSWLFAGPPYPILIGLALTVGFSALPYSATFAPVAPGAELRYPTWPIVAEPLAPGFALSEHASQRPFPASGRHS